MSEAAFRAVSADSHVNPPAEMWREYLPAEFRDRAPTVERTDEGDFEVFEGQRRPMMALAAAAGRRPEEFAMSVRRFSEVRAGGWEPGPRVEDQDIDGVDAEVLFGAAVGAPLPSRDADLTRAGYTAYNHWLADFCSYAPDRLIGMAYIPCDDPDVAVAEARAAAARGLRGAVLPHVPPGGDWAAEEWAPLWRTIVELGWPAHFHVGGSASIGAVAQTRGAFINSLVASKFNMPLSLGALVFSGVFAEHPDLKLVCVEGQIGWIPFWKYYIDHVYEKHRWHQDVHLPNCRRPTSSAKCGSRSWRTRPASRRATRAASTGSCGRTTTRTPRRRGRTARRSSGTSSSASPWKRSARSSATTASTSTGSTDSIARRQEVTCSTT